MRNLDPKGLLQLTKRDENLIRNTITLEIIKALVDKYPNDMGLGSEVRRVIKSFKN